MPLFDCWGSSSLYFPPKRYQQIVIWIIKRWTPISMKCLPEYNVKSDGSYIVFFHEEIPQMVRKDNLWGSGMGSGLRSSWWRRGKLDPLVAAFQNHCSPDFLVDLLTLQKEKRSMSFSLGNVILFLNIWTVSLHFYIPWEQSAIIIQSN